MLIKFNILNNSISIEIPNEILESTGFLQNDMLDIMVENGQMMIKPIKPHQVTLAFLLSAVTPENQHGRIDFGASIGRELI